MPRNWKNIYIDDAIHHITGTIHQWQRILLYPRITDIFYEQLIEMAENWDINLLGYVIMPEHFHLLARSDTRNNIEKFIRGLRRSISGKAKNIIEENNEEFQNYCLWNNIELYKFYTKTAGKSEFRFWKEKPRVFPIDREKDILRILKYMHHNPIRRGLVENLDQWKHSSYRHYEFGDKCIVNVGLDSPPRQDVAEKTLHPDAQI